MKILKNHPIITKLGSSEITPITSDWFNTANVNISNAQILPDSGTISWGKVGMFGTVPVSTDFEFEFTPKYMPTKSSDGFLVAGLSAQGSAAGYLNTLYAFYISIGTNINIYEGWVAKASNIGGGFTIGDILKIKRVGTQITYYKNNTLIYSSITPNSSAMDVSIDINRYLGTENNKITLN